MQTFFTLLSEKINQKHSFDNVVTQILKQGNFASQDNFFNLGCCFEKFILSIWPGLKTHCQLSIYVEKGVSILLYIAMAQAQTPPSRGSFLMIEENKTKNDMIEGKWNNNLGDLNNE